MAKKEATPKAATGPDSSLGVEVNDPPEPEEEKKTPKSKRDALDEIDALKAKLYGVHDLPEGALD